MTSNSNNSSGPTHNDVICGRGGLGRRHIGNKKYRRLVEANVEQYVSSPKFEKIKLAKRIVDYVHRQSPRGRFVKRNKEGIWTELDAKKAVRKTSQTFRDIIGELKQRSSDTDQASVESHVSATDSLISEIFAQAEAPTSAGVINTLTIPEETFIEPEMITSASVAAPTSMSASSVPGDIYVSDSENSLGQWLNEGGLFEKMMDLEDQKIPHDSEISALSLPSFDSANAVPDPRSSRSV